MPASFPDCCRAELRSECDPTTRSKACRSGRPALPELHRFAKVLEASGVVVKYRQRKGERSRPPADNSGGKHWYTLTTESRSWPVTTYRGSIRRGSIWADENVLVLATCETLLGEFGKSRFRSGTFAMISGLKFGAFAGNMSAHVCWWETRISGLLVVTCLSRGLCIE